MSAPATRGGPPRPTDRAALVLYTAILAYVLARGLVLLGAVPPWQGPDEPGHAQYALLLAHGTVPVTGSPSVERAILASMARHDFYTRLGLAAPGAPPLAFADVPRLGGDPTQIDRESPVGYLPYALAAALGEQDGVEASLRRMRVVSLLLAAGTVLATAWTAAPLLGAWLAPLAAAVVAAAPMLGFSGAVANNDLTAALLATIWFGAYVRVRVGARPRSVRALAGLVGLALVASAAKRTALFLVPLALLVVAAEGAAALRRRASPDRTRVAAGGAIALAAIAAGVALVASLLPIETRAAGWRRVGASWGSERVPGGRTGGHALAIVDDATTQWRYLEQSVPAQAGALVAARAWVRADRSGPVGLVVNDDAGTWLSASAMAGREWTPVGLVGSLAPAATTARLAVFPGDGTAAGTGAILVDDVQLDLDGRAALPNGTAESPARLSGALLTWAADYTDMARLVGSVPGGLAAPRRTLERAWRGAFFLHRSSWGGFGWLMIWPSRPYERAAGLCTAFILAGLAVALVRPGSLLAGADRAACLRVCSVACVLAVIASVVGSMAGWGTDSLPQGRYLLPALAAFALPAVSLADRVWPRWGPLLLAAAFLSVDAGLVARVMLPSFAVP